MSEQSPRCRCTVPFVVADDRDPTGRCLKCGRLEREQGATEHKRAPSHGRASWSGGVPSTPRSTVPRSDYLPCRNGCGRVIHPRLHEPDAPERGRCMRCRTGRTIETATGGTA